MTRIGLDPLFVMQASPKGQAVSPAFCEHLLGSAVEFLGGDIFCVHGDRPVVAEGVFQLASESWTGFLFRSLQRSGNHRGSHSVLVRVKSCHPVGQELAAGEI